ncbi:MAG: Na+/H+ antiporter subunit E [Pseudomonadota bacterium]
MQFFLYLPWLFTEIFLANLHVAYLVLHPRMPIRPQIIRFRTRLESDFALVTLANSIPLTPGTITLDIQDGSFFVHVLSQKGVEDLQRGRMEARVARVFHRERKKRP